MLTNLDLRTAEKIPPIGLVVAAGPGCGLASRDPGGGQHPDHDRPGRLAAGAVLGLSTDHRRSRRGHDRRGMPGCVRGFVVRLALASALFLAAALWVPINRQPVPDEYSLLSWRASFVPRALIGTVADVAGLGGTGFVWLNLAGQLVFLFLLLDELLRQADGTSTLRRQALVVTALAVLLSFHQLLFYSNFFSGFVDVHSYLLLLLAFRAVSRGDAAPAARCLVLAALLSSVALLNHEKSLYDSAILATWLWFRFGWLPAGVYFTPVATSFAALTALVPSEYQAGIIGYLGNLGALRRYLAEESGSLVGIFYGGGWLYLLWMAAAGLLVRQAFLRAPRTGLRAVGFVVVTAVLCLAPLLVAHDTNRLVGLIWFPALLLFRETGLVSVLVRGGRPLALTAALATLQLALPPVFIFNHGAVPLNYYAQRTLSTVCAGQPNAEWTAWGGRLRLHQDQGHQGLFQRRILPLRLFRKQR